MLSPYFPILGKYDEEEEEALTLGEFGLDSSKPESSLKQENLTTIITPISDYGTVQGEISSRQKRRRQKLRKRTGMLDIVSELETQKDELMGNPVTVQYSSCVLRSRGKSP